MRRCSGEYSSMLYKNVTEKSRSIADMLRLSAVILLVSLEVKPLAILEKN